MKLKVLFLGLLLTAGAFVAKANNSNPPGDEASNAGKLDVSGGVLHADTHKPLGNVAITAYTNNKKEKTVYTDNNGAYSFGELKPGTYKFVFEKSGYKKVTKEKVIIRGDDGLLVNVELDDEEVFDLMPSLLLDF